MRGILASLWGDHRLQRVNQASPNVDVLRSMTIQEICFWFHRVRTLQITNSLFSASAGALNINPSPRRKGLYFSYPLTDPVIDLSLTDVQALDGYPAQAGRAASGFNWDIRETLFNGSAEITDHDEFKLFFANIARLGEGWFIDVEFVGLASFYSAPNVLDAQHTIVSRSDFYGVDSRVSAATMRITGEDPILGVTYDHTYPLYEFAPSPDTWGGELILEPAASDGYYPYLDSNGNPLYDTETGNYA